ncbi:MAG TPA: hypothetical protein VLD18_13440, partial [Verrucomicrobiae bacterium]|nr:hypothetical protein [Verrucomicrobiae bacterium]
GDGRDDVSAEMVLLDLQGMSSVGPVNVKLRADVPSLGEIEEQANHVPGVLDVPPFTAVGYADSFFDIWTEITLNGQTLITEKPLHLTSVISHKPPAPGESYENPFLEPVELIDPLTGQGTGIFIIKEVHTPTPVDECPNLRIEMVGDGILKISWPAGGDCVLECTRVLARNPANTDWIVIEPPYQVNEGRNCVFIDPRQTGPMAFYRLRKPGTRPIITGVIPATARPGDLVTIVGTGFGNNPDNLCAVVMDGFDPGSEPFDGRYIPIRVLSASPTRITGLLGPVPFDAQPGPIMVGLGHGNKGRPQFVFPDIEAVEPIWVWNNLGSAGQVGVSPGNFTPVPVEPPPQETWFFSPPPSNGVLCVWLDQPWPDNAEVSIVARAHDLTTGAGGHDLDGPTIRFVGGGTTLECAERIADVLRCAFLQQAGVVIEVEVTEVSPGVVKITVRIPNGFIDHGLLTICV